MRLRGCSCNNSHPISGIYQVLRLLPGLKFYSKNDIKSSISQMWAPKLRDINLSIVTKLINNGISI